MHQLEEGAANGDTSGARLAGVIFTGRLILDKLGELIQLRAETGDFFFQRRDFRFNIHDMAEVCRRQGFMRCRES